MRQAPGAVPYGVPYKQFVMTLDRNIKAEAGPDAVGTAAFQKMGYKEKPT